MKKKLVELFNRITDKEERLSFSDVFSFSKNMHYKYFVIANETECEEMHVVDFRNGRDAIKCKRIMPETYVAELRNAKVFGENDLIVCNRIALHDMLVCEYAEKMNFRKNIVKGIDWKEKKIEIRYHIPRHKTIEKGIFLGGNFSNSYYHFVVDILPKLYYVGEAEEFKDYPLLIDKRTYTCFREIIDIFNVYHKDIICLKADVAYKVKNLVCTSHCAWYDRYMTGKFFGHIYDGNALKFVRRHAMEYIKKYECKNSEQESKTSKIYVSRAKVADSRKRLVNEEEVENIFKKNGFVSVYPEEMSFAEQVRLFSTCKVFAGVTGAAFTNTLFLPEDATIICMNGLSDEDAYSGINLFPSLWNTIGKGKFILLKGQETAESQKYFIKDNTKKFTLELQDVEEMLKLI